jgi:hypothetical protein
MALEGEVWTLWFEGGAVRLRDSRGLRFIATLLADPAREFHVLDLAARGGAPAGGRRRPGAGGGGPGGAGVHRPGAHRRLRAAGTPRRLDDPAERARKAVRNRIRDAVARIEASQPALGRHLRASIRTGTFCSYQPERPVAWQVRPGR